MKTLNKILIFTMFIISGIGINVYAQATSSVKLNVLPQSKLYIDGTSTLHDFTINAKKVDGYVELEKSAVDGDTLQSIEKLTGLKVVIPVKKLDTDKSSMNDNMDDALKADDNPNITYELKTIDPSDMPKTVGDSVEFKTTGNLTIAGKPNSIEMTVKGVKDKDGNVTFVGQKTVKMTDYGVEPPTMLFGTIKTHNAVVVHFNLVVASK